MLSDIIAAIVVLAIVGGAVAYIVKQKRQGVKCIGCATGKAACAHAAASAGAGTASATGAHACVCGCGSVDDMVARMAEAAEAAVSGEVAAMGTTGMAEAAEATAEKESCCR